MHPRTEALPPLHGWTVLSLRPRGQHAGLRAAASRLGARTLALPQHAIETVDDAPTRADLRQALAAGIVLFTSPNAVRSAAALEDLAPRRGQCMLAIGSGTCSALRRRGVAARAPTRMDSEGLLAMPEMADVAGRGIGLVTGAGGRNLLAPALLARGAQVFRVDAYRRVPVAFSAQAQSRLTAALATPERVVLALSSAEALARLLAQASPALRRDLSRAAVAAASPRLAEAAAEAGFRRVAIAASARPADLVHAAVDAFV